MLLSPGAYRRDIPSAQMSGSRDNGAVGNGDLEIEIGTDRVKVRHAVVVIVNPDVDRSDVTDGWHGVWSRFGKLRSADCHVVTGDAIISLYHLLWVLQ